MNDENKRPILDIDRDRIREIVSEAYRISCEYIDGGFFRSKNQIMSDLERQLGCGLIAATFRIPIGSRRYPDIIMRVNPRRKEVALVSLHKKVIGRVNRILRTYR